MLKQKIAFFILLPFFFTGCDHISEHFESHSHDDHTASNTGTLSLDGVKKWKADASTSERIRVMKSITEEYKNRGESLTPAEYHEINMRLSSEVDALIQGCKMTGPAHDELHIFLGILNSNISSLHADDASKSYKAFTDIERNLNLFSDYFE